jgi:hypothetical protein
MVARGRRPGDGCEMVSSVVLMIPKFSLLPPCKPEDSNGPESCLASILLLSKTGARVELGFRGFDAAGL